MGAPQCAGARSHRLLPPRATEERLVWCGGQTVVLSHCLRETPPLRSGGPRHALSSHRGLSVRRPYRESPVVCSFEVPSEWDHGAQPAEGSRLLTDG